jgi:hypothetical protein
MSQEFLGSHRDDRLDAEPPAPGVRAVPLADRERAAELETRGWFWLEAVRPVPAPELAAMDARALDARLRGLVERRRRWDGLFGMLALDFVRRRMATDLGFAGLGQWVAERLGMSLRAFQQRVWVERRLEALPRLRDAMERGELSYEKARLVAGVADGRTLHGWVRRAKGMTCAELERAVTAAERAQACGRGRFQARVPAWVAGLVRDAMRAAEVASGAALDPGACLGRVARHFVETWGPLERRRRTPSSRARERDGGWCSAPACSRPGAQGHHVVLRSRGGGNGLENLTPLCAPHHLRGVHAGRLRVRGTAPGALAWEIRSGATWEPFVP